MNVFRQKNKNQPEVKSKRELRAKMYLKYACETNITPSEKLSRLWTCYQKFEELKLMKNARVLGAVSSDSLRELLSSHTHMTIEAFAAILDTQDSRLPLGVVHLAKNGKLAVSLGIRLGLCEKDDRQYGLELELDKFLHDGFESKTYKDLEWQDKHVSETMYAFTDLLIKPFYKFRWLCIALAFKDVQRYVQKAIRLLEQYNIIARAFRSEEALDKKSAKIWVEDLDSLQFRLNPVGALAQAAKKMKRRSDTLRKRIKQPQENVSSEKAKVRERLLKMLKNDDPETQMDMKSRRATMRHELVSNFKLQLVQQEDQKPPSRRRRRR